MLPTHLVLYLVSPSLPVRSMYFGQTLSLVKKSCRALLHPAQVQLYIPPSATLLAPIIPVDLLCFLVHTARRNRNALWAGRDSSGDAAGVGDIFNALKDAAVVGVDYIENSCGDLFVIAADQFVRDGEDNSREGGDEEGGEMHGVCVLSACIREGRCCGVENGVCGGSG
jgi:hypothetical protein